MQQNAIILFLISHKIKISWDWFCTACHIVTAAMNPLNSTSLDLARLRCYLKDGYQKPEKIVHFFHNALKILSDSQFRTKLKSSINLSKTKSLSKRMCGFFKHTHIYFKLFHLTSSKFFFIELWWKNPEISWVSKCLP